ncbi:MULTISPECIES: alpha/beta fold hydrolase [Enterococcus]|uniref:Alpha/beta hydrolase n=1 Tax=Enterococcus alishanensis TaxID=1303817 RepID=A0ABS6TD78_9ENTE|nr:alpha/beta hydrolase [Enterococcus alishanensis]MBV7390837.1 alpha/beta hydrolase [Enterococcus alishanensis]
MTKTIHPGKMVTVNQHQMHIFTAGDGDKTFVFMAGSGTAAPTIDFKPLWQILAKKYRIVVIEKAGYGWSEATTVSRDLATMLEESREALHLANIQAPFILVPHSMSGLEALYWGQKYPTEVQAIIGLDPAVPAAYEKLKIPSKTNLKISKTLINLGVHRPFMKLVAKNVWKKRGTSLSSEDFQRYVDCYKESLFSSDVINEVLTVRENVAICQKGEVPKDIPVYYFISDGKEIGLKEDWRPTLIAYLAQFETSKYLLLDCGHYVHGERPEEIAEEIESFITEIS